MGKLFSAGKQILFYLLILSTITGCGAGGIDTSATPSSSTPPSTTTLTITGRVTDGFIAGAKIQAYQINTNGTRGNAIGSSTTTDAQGNYTLSLAYSGPVLVESSGGSYTDWATGTLVTLGSADKLSAVMSDAKDAVTINVTPLTNMASLRALQDMATNKTAVATAIDVANTKIGAYFGGIDIIKDAPVDPSVSNSSSGVSQTRIDHAMVLAGISQSASGNNLNPFSLSIALAKDASDGIFDGKQGGTQLTVANAAGNGTTNLSPTAGIGDLGTGIQAYENSAANKSGGAITAGVLVSLSSAANIGIIVAPPVPTGLTATATSHAKIDLAWTASTGAAGYKIYKAGALLAAVTTNAASDSGLTASNQYCYAVSAYDVSGNESGLSSQVCATTSPQPAPVPPPVPTAPALSVVSESQIDFSWNASSGAASYKVYRGGVFWTTVQTNSVSDTGLSPSTQYCYTVSALDSAGTASAQATELCATTPVAAPSKPTALQATTFSTFQINLSWAASVGATNYKIYRGGVLLKSSSTVTASDSGLQAGKKYCYTVSAVGATGNESAQSDQACATTTAIDPPTNLTAEVISSSQVDLAWDAATDAAAYKIFKGGSLLKSVTTTSASDTGLSANTQYCYAIVTVDATGNESVPSSNACATTPPAPVPDSIDLLVSSTQLNSDGVSTVKLTALVKDNANRAMKDQKVDFTADSGLLVVTSDTTDMNGTATATLGTSGNPVNRLIEVKATTGSKEASNTVNVSGTTIDISGLSSLSLGDTTPFTIFLKDSAGVGIPGKTITVTSDMGNDITVPDDPAVPEPYKTNANGQITVNITATQSGTDTISASFTGANKDFTLTVDPNIFKIIAPTPAGKEVNIGTSEPITVEYKINGAAVNGATINFATTRGILSNSTVATGADGKATISISSTNSGPALISAFVTGGPSAQLAIEFVATTASTISLQANPASIGTNGTGLTAEKSLITAIVRDANNNLVKNKTIKFTIERDSSGGSLSPGSATTDGSGTANVYFIGGATPGAKDGVTIQAEVVGATPAITATATLTVAHEAMFITVGTGPTIEKIDPNRYKQNYVALVTDAAGYPVKNAAVSATVIPRYFRKGYYVWGGEVWVLNPTLEASSTTLPAVPACANEDGLTRNSLYDYNAVLDPGEDANNSGLLDPGNVASVTATSTDDNGFSTVSIVYARDYAYWVNVRLEVSASTTGDTARAYVDFELPGAGGDYSARTQVPPGYISPFGTSATCFDTRPDPPGGLTVVAASASKINLSWQPAERATGYKIYRNGVFLKSTAAVNGADTGLGAGTQYCYSLAAYDGTGNDSAQSGSVCATTPSLLAPTNFSITAISPSQINLTWTASAGAVRYNIYQVYQGVTSSLNPVTATAAQVTSLDSDAQYCYTVAAVDGAGLESAPTSQFCATTPKLASPTSLTVTAVNATRIDLSWSPVSGAVGYNIYRSGSSTPLTSLRAPDDPAATVTFSDTDLLPSTPYCYTVSAYDAAYGGPNTNTDKNESLKTSRLCATTYRTPPADPADLVVRSVTPTQVVLSWTAVSGVSQYKIYRDDGVQLALLASTLATTYTDNTVAANTQYTYQVRAIDSTGSESPGQASQGTVNTGLTVPANVTVTANSQTQITISWNNAGGGTLVAGYKVYIIGSVTPPRAVPAAALPATLVSLVDSGLAPSTQYCYYVTATDAAGNESARSSTFCAATEGQPSPGYIDLLVSNIQLNSDGISPLTLTALVRDSNNRAMADQEITFQAAAALDAAGTPDPAGTPADAGILTVVNLATNASGQATATLGTGGNQKNRFINVTAGSGALTTTKTVEVVGTTVTVSGQATTVIQNGTITLTVYLKDGSGRVIPYQGVSLTSATGNTLTPATVTTDASGQASTIFTATAVGADEVTATSASMNATNVTAPFAITVTANPNAQALTFTTPNAGSELAINLAQTVTVHYADNTGGIGGATVNFASTRGDFNAPSALTDVNGDATLTITSAAPGPATLTAAIAGGPTAAQAVEFIATTPAKLNVQADPATIGINLSGSTTQTSNIVAVVRDAGNYLVKNQTVNFNITQGGGSLASGTAITNSFGAASVQYIAGETPSALNGIEITATVAGTVITATTKLTVAKEALYITVGTGNIVRTNANNLNFYDLDFGVLVTDGGGNPQQGASVTTTLLPVVYLKGNYTTTISGFTPPGWVWDTGTTGHWQQTLSVAVGKDNQPIPPPPNMPYPWPGTPTLSCANEDLTFYNDPNMTFYLSNGILDTEDINGNGALDAGEDLNGNGILDKEDFNGNGKLDPGGVAAVTSSTTTDANGVGNLTLTYARDFATWVIVRIDVKVRVTGGTEGAASTTVLLPGLRSDYTTFSLTPPGSVSPFGQSDTCVDDK